MKTIYKYHIEIYNLCFKETWNNFISKSINGTFLFYRDFMEYHQDRFKDFSLLIFKEEELLAVLPANKVDNTIISHQGLTFGGLIVAPSISIEEVNTLLDKLRLFLKEKEIISLTVKSIPEFYSKSTSFDLYQVMLDKEFQLVLSNMVLAIDYSKPLAIHKTKRKHYRNNKHDFQIRESRDFASFWNQVLVPRLAEKHNTKPVHTLSEITMLSERFPEHIMQYDIYLEDEILAGITIFKNEHVLKSQYGATTNEGEKTRALDYLFLHLIYKYQEVGKHYFSMGTVADSNYESGYNPGLLKQKEELGCQVFEQQILKIEI